jgi:anti-anti-sigma regulatory factor
MKITVSVPEKTIPVSVISLEGALDGSNFECLIDTAQKLHAARVRNLILDLGKLTFISSAGLSGLHEVGLLFRDKKPAQKESESWDTHRWEVYHQSEGSHKHLLHQHVKLLSPTREVRELLDMIGFNSLFEIFEDIQQALASFRQPVPAMAENKA